MADPDRGEPADDAAPTSLPEAPAEAGEGAAEPAGDEREPLGARVTDEERRRYEAFVREVFGGRCGGGRC
jgi:hypothetical protein